jgi:hypothetical protein
MLPVEAAWLAGFIDGEGCLQVVRARRVTYDASVMVGHTDLAVLERCSALAGGSICLVRTRSAAWKPSYRWNVRGKGVTPLLEAVLPYLVVKQEQAKILLILRLSAEVGARLGKSTLSSQEREWRETLKLATNALNHRGSGDPSPEMLAALANVRQYLATSDGQLTLLRLA